ncbi:MAG: polysaccharide deacetylase family protein [Planctomycetota bacterium]
MMSSGIKSGLKKMVVYTLLGLDGLHKKRGIPILLYHRVANEFNPEHDVTTVLTQEFASQMDWLLQRKYHVVTLEEAIELLEKNREPDNKYVAITFDDGHYDNYQFAYPVLKDRGLRATVFIVTDYVGHTGWLDRNGSWSDERTGSEPFYKFLSWDDLRQIADVFDVGSHGRMHRPLTMLSGTEMQEELDGSRQAIYDHLGIWPAFFCYPYGATNKIIVECTKEAKYKGAFSTQKGLNNGCTNRWLMKRNTVGMGITPLQFDLLLSDRIKVYARISNWLNGKRK